LGAISFLLIERPGIKFGQWITSRTIDKLQLSSTFRIDEYQRLRLQQQCNELFDQARFDDLQTALSSATSGQDGTWKYEIVVALLTGATDEQIIDLVMPNILARPDDRKPIKILRIERSVSIVPMTSTF